MIPLSLPGRGKVVVETAVNNDVRPDAVLASDVTSGIYKDKGMAYGQFSEFNVCFCGLDPGSLKFETVRTHKQHICF